LGVRYRHTPTIGPVAAGGRACSAASSAPGGQIKKAAVIMVNATAAAEESEALRPNSILTSPSGQDAGHSQSEQT